MSALVSSTSRKRAHDREVFRLGGGHGEVHGDVETRAEGVDDLVDDDLGGGRAGRQAERFNRADAVPGDFGGALHEQRHFCAGAFGDFDEAHGIGRVRRADDQEKVGAGGRFLHRLLAVGGGVADRFGGRRLDQREFLLQRADDAGRVLDRKRGLGDEAERCRIGRLEARDVGLVLDQRNGAFGQLPHRADHLRMAGMADQEHVAAEALVAHRLLVHLGDQRAGRVEVEEVARLGVGRHGFRHAVGGEDHRAGLMLRRDLARVPR